MVPASCVTGAARLTVIHSMPPGRGMVVTVKPRVRGWAAFSHGGSSRLPRPRHRCRARGQARPTNGRPCPGGAVAPPVDPDARIDVLRDRHQAIQAATREQHVRRNGVGSAHQGSGRLADLVGGTAQAFGGCQIGCCTAESWSPPPPSLWQRWVMPRKAQIEHKGSAFFRES